VPMTALAMCLLGPSVSAPEAKGTPPGHRLVSVIDTRDFGAETLRVGDLDGDGTPDLLFAQSVYATREITCLTATTVAGEVLWQTGVPSRDNGTIYSDLPVQVYDWNRDGRNEVLYVKQAVYAEWEGSAGQPRERATRYEGNAEMIVLEGATGRELERLPLPAPADDSFLFADLTGRGRREDLVVKDRYWNMWGVSHSGEVLWHFEGSVGHFPAIADVDGDGRDEVFVGFALVDHDGSVMFSHDPGGAHQDACYIVKLPDGGWRLLFGNHGMHCLTPDGAELWAHPLAEAQHVVAGRYRTNSAVQFAVIDRGQPRADGSRDPATLYLYDPEGKELWRRVQPEGGWYAACIALDWSGSGVQREILVYSRGPGQPVAICNGDGDIVETLPMVYSPGVPEADRSAHYYVTRADVYGDSRDEVIMFGSRGACIYANTRPLELATLYNNTLYPGM